MKRQQGILHAENAVGMCFLCLKSRSNGLETFRSGKSRGVGVSIIFILFAVLRYSEPPMSPSFCCWSEYVFRSGNLFRGTNQPLAPKMECHHHSGNMSYSNIPSSSTASCSRYFFFAAPRSQSVRGWPVRLAEFSLIEIRREVPTLATVVSCLTESWRTAATNFYAQSPIFCVLCGAIGTGGNGWLLLVWPTGSWHVRAQDTKYLDLLDSIPPNGFPH